MPIVQNLPAGPFKFDGVGSGNSSTGTTNLPFTHSNKLGGDLVLAWVWFANTASNPAIGATYGGAPMSLVGSPFAYYNGSGYEYYMALLQCRAAAGPASVVMLPTASSYIKANTVSYSNAAIGSGLITASATGTALSMSVPSAPGHIAVQSFIGHTNSSAAFTNYNQNVEWQGNGGTWTDPMVIGDAPGAAVVPFSCTQGSSIVWAGIGVDLVAA